MPDDREREDTTDNHDDSDRDQSDADAGFSFSLPPIRLPPLFPEDFRVLWPAGDTPPHRVSKRTAAAALVAFDLVDAALALTVDSVAVTAARTVGGSLIAAGTFGLLGVPYVLEAVAALAGYGWLTVAPTLTLLLLVRAVREVF
jgi:hypothetical protein